MSFTAAIDAAAQLQAALKDELLRAQQAQKVLTSLDVNAVFEQAQKREDFNHRSAVLSKSLYTAIDRLAQSQGQSDITLAALRALNPREGEELALIFSDIRSLSASLAQQDQLNQDLTTTALRLVRAYVGHLAPKPSAYTRQGQLAANEARTHSEHV